MDVPFVIGSEEHKRAFCGVLIATFDPTKPSIQPWPRLSADALKRLTDLPFWDVAVETEGYASCRMQAIADTLTDPMIKQAISTNAFEEGRHKLILRDMLRFYDIKLQDEKPYGTHRGAEWLFLRTGYGECFDSFFAFGLFKMAKDSGYFPPELVDVFEPIVQEEARHILFFVNWLAYTAKNRGFIGSLLFRLKGFAALVISGLGRVSLAGAADYGGSSDNFVAAGGSTLTTGLTVRSLLQTALAEDTCRMAPFNRHLLRPRLMPFLATLAVSVIKLFNRS
jgi:hypothetical protein